MYSEGYDFSAHSALFNVVDNSIFIRDKVANQVNYIYPDKNGMNLEINNEERLRNIIFKEIQYAYNNRINNYNLNLHRLDSDIDKEKLEIVRFKLINSDDKVGYSGFYHIYPRVFRCNNEKCGDYKVLNAREWKNFNPSKCQNKGCNGEYTQISMLAFCETCGNVETVRRSCPNHGYDHLKLIQPDKEAPATWRLKCRQCDWEDDFMPFPCNHTEPYTKRNLCDESPTPFTLINVRRGGLFKSCVKTIVDVKQVNNDSEYIEEIIIGHYFNLLSEFNFPKEKEIKQMNNLLDLLKRYPPEEREDAYAFIPEESFIKAEELEENLKEIREKYDEFSLPEIMDYLILKEESLSDSSEFLNMSLNSSFKKFYNISDEQYDNFKQAFGIEDVTYIPDIHLVSSSFGYIKGVNKFYEEGFIPHFEPHWINKDEGIFKAYAYPFETEGIIFDLDKVKLANWVIRNFAPERSAIDSEDEARDYLFNLIKSSKEYEGLKTLIHTFSHVLIKRSSLYTGLNSDSCSELLFPKTGSFMIYSTSNVNIGGFSFVFENSMFKWFNDIKLDIDECIFDPFCMEEEGSCFSCMHLPEFVCTEFNQFLDRDVFIGKTNRIKEGFWK